jgi:hypothetical protein
MNVGLPLVVEVWNVIKESIIGVDRVGVADNVVSLLIDHGLAADEIRKAFRGDGDIADALKFYLESDGVDYSDEDEELDDDVDYSFGDSEDDDYDDWS